MLNESIKCRNITIDVPKSIYVLNNMTVETEKAFIFDDTIKK